MSSYFEQGFVFTYPSFFTYSPVNPLTMERQRVASSIIRSVGYDDLTETLEIEFNHKKIRRFIRVPSYLFREMMQSPSLGKFYLQYIRGQFEEED
jgi:hypothetical protein